MASFPFIPGSVREVPDPAAEAERLAEARQGGRGLVAGCVFCSRIDGHAYDAGDEWAVTFEPLSPVTPGHRLFIPRRHEPSALGSAFIAGKVMEYAVKWAIGHKVGACNLITSAGAEATQTVFHYHLHLVPRREGDGLYLPWTGQQRDG